MNEKFSNFICRNFVRNSYGEIKNKTKKLQRHFIFNWEKRPLNRKPAWKTFLFFQYFLLLIFAWKRNFLKNYLWFLRVKAKVPVAVKQLIEKFIQFAEVKHLFLVRVLLMIIKIFFNSHGNIFRLFFKNVRFYLIVNFKGFQNFNWETCTLFFLNVWIKKWSI